MCPYETGFREGQTYTLQCVRYNLSWIRMYRDHSSHITHDSISVTGYAMLCSRVGKYTSVDDEKSCLRGSLSEITWKEKG